MFPSFDVCYISVIIVIRVSPTAIEVKHPKQLKREKVVKVKAQKVDATQTRS